MERRVEAAATRHDGLPGLDCGLCGCRTCDEFAVRLTSSPDLIKRCTPKAASSSRVLPLLVVDAPVPPRQPQTTEDNAWIDSLGRPFDFYLEHFPEDPGPREVILPRNPLITREMEVTVGDVLLGRPLGMSCGCPITHCGVATQVDRRTGVIVWCVTGPLAPRERGFKDIGYYSAEAYEGIIRRTRTKIDIGARYFFQPRMCMLQWRHSGLVNFVNRTDAGLQVRLEGLWIG